MWVNNYYQDDDLFFLKETLSVTSEIYEALNKNACIGLFRLPALIALPITLLLFLPPLGKNISIYYLEYGVIYIFRIGNVLSKFKNDQYFLLAIYPLNWN